MADYIHALDITLLQPNPFQPRNKIKLDDITELADSIKQFGVLEPIVVADTPAGYQIIAGERRWRASQQAGLTKVPVVIKKVTPHQMLEMALIENVQRSDLNALERAQAFQQLMREFNLNTEDIAKRISKSDSYVKNSLRLLTLPDAIKDGLVGGEITEGHARALAGIADHRSMIEAYKQLLADRGSVRDAEEIARIWREENTETGLPRTKKTLTRVVDPEVKEWEDRLQKIIAGKSQHLKSSIKLTRSQTQTRIIITLKGAQNETQQALKNFMSLAE